MEHSVYIRTVSSKPIWSTLQNQIRLVYGLVWYSNMHCKYTSTPNQLGGKQMYHCKREAKSGGKKVHCGDSERILLKYLYYFY